MRTLALTGKSEHRFALALACGTGYMPQHKPIIIILPSDAAYDKPLLKKFEGNIFQAPSDHHSIIFKVNILPNPTASANNIHLPTYHNHRLLQIHNRPNASPLIKNPPKALTDLLDLYFSTLHSLLDCYVPLLTKTNRSSRSSPSP